MPIASFGKHGIELGGINFPTTHQCHQAIGILRHIPGVMTRSPLGNEAGETEGIVVVQERTVSMTPLGITGTGIDNVPIIAGTFHQSPAVVRLSQSASHLGQRKVIVGIFQSTRYLLTGMERIGHTVLQRNIAILDIRIEGPSPHTIPVFLQSGRTVKSILPHAFVGFFHVKVCNPLYPGVGQSGCSVIANHGRRITVPTRENGHPAALFVLAYQRLHHFTAPLRSNQIDKRMQGTVRVPQAVIIVICLSLGQPYHRLTGSKSRITAVHIVVCTRQEAGPIESTVELGQGFPVITLHLNETETLFPNISQFTTGLLKVPVRNLRQQVALRSVGIHERRRCLHEHFLTSSYIKSYIGTDSRTTILLQRSIGQRIGREGSITTDFLLEFHYKMSTESGRLSPALIDTMNRIIAINTIVHRINAHETLPFVTVRGHHQIGLAGLLIGKAEDSRTRTGCQLRPNTLIGQGNRIIGRCSHFIRMGETGGTLPGLATQGAIQRHQRHGAVVLGTAAYNPMGIAEPLEQAVTIVIGGNALLFGITGLRCPEIHAIGLEHSRQGLPVLFGILTEHAGCPRRTGRRTHPRIYIRQSRYPGRCIGTSYATTKAACRQTYSNEYGPSHNLIYIFFLYNG